MDVTISVLDAALEQIPAVRTRRIQDMAEAAVYAGTDAEGRAKMNEIWKSHTEAQENQKSESASKGLFTVNGKRTNSKGLRYWFQVAAGWGNKVSG